MTGSSRNTGLGIAERVARAGALVVVKGPRPENVVRAALHIREATGAAVIEAPADLSTRPGVDALFEAVRRGPGGLDVLVNNAVHLGVGPEFVEAPDEMLEAVFALNVLGYYRCGQKAVRMMIESGVRGAIINVGSNASERAPRGRSAYVASKAAIDGLTRAMAVDLAQYGIRVNAVAPGYILTDRWDGIDADTATRRRQNIPLGEPATTGDVAEAVMYLASDAAANVTGARLVVDGGVSAQFMPADMQQ